MYTKSQMNKMSNEELNEIAQKKNKKGIATAEAYLAQEIIWERRFYVTESLRNDYTGAIEWD